MSRGNVESVCKANFSDDVRIAFVRLSAAVRARGGRGGWANARSFAYRALQCGRFAAVGHGTRGLEPRFRLGGPFRILFQTGFRHRVRGHLYEKFDSENRFSSVETVND